MKVYILDQQFLSDKEHEQLKNAFTSAGHEILFREWKTSQEVIDGARDADAIILMAVQITREVIEALPNLKVISRCGTDTDNVDWRAATEQRGGLQCPRSLYLRSGLPHPSPCCWRWSGS